MPPLVIKAADVRETAAPDHYVFTMSAEHDREGRPAAVEATKEAEQNPRAHEVYQEVKERYDPTDYAPGEVVARVHPDGTVEWPFEDDDGVMYA